MGLYEVSSEDFCCFFLTFYHACLVSVRCPRSTLNSMVWVKCTVFLDLPSGFPVSIKQNHVYPATYLETSISHAVFLKLTNTLSSLLINPDLLLPPENMVSLFASLSYCLSSCQDFWNTDLGRWINKKSTCHISPRTWIRIPSTHINYWTMCL